MPSPFDAILFDLDGTIVDSIELIIRCFQKTTEVHLGQPASRAEVLALIGKPLRPELERRNPEKAQVMLETYRETQYAYHDEMVKPFPGIIPLIERLTAHGISVGVVTSKARRGTNAALSRCGPIAHLLQTIVTVDDVTKHKPHPEPILHALSNLALDPSRACYVGDTIFDMEAARGARIHPVGVTWGVASRETLLQHTESVFDSMAELEEFLLTE